MLATKESALRDFLDNELLPAISQKKSEGSGSQTDSASWIRYGESVQALKENLDAVLTPLLGADDEDLDQIRLRDLAEGNTFRNCGGVLLSLSGDLAFDEDLADMVDTKLSELV